MVVVVVVEATVVAVEDPVPRRLQQMQVQTDLSCSVMGCVVAFYVVNVLEKIQFGGAEKSADTSAVSETFVWTRDRQNLSVQHRQVFCRSTVHIVGFYVLLDGILRT